MHDTEPMRVGNGLAGLQHELHRLLDWKRPVLLQPRAQIAAIQVFHYHIGSAIFERTNIDNASHMLALDLDRRACFARETPHYLGVAKYFG